MYRTVTTGISGSLEGLGRMWAQLSATQKFKAVALGVLAPCLFVLGMLMLFGGAPVRGVWYMALGVYFAYLSYQTATSPPATTPASSRTAARRTRRAGGSDAEFKKCPACGKFTRKANVCRHCGHDLNDGVSPTPPTKVQEKLSPTSDAPEAEAHENSATVRCKYCQHVQMAPVSQETFLCEHCKAPLTGRTAPAESS
jgi:ribosomal protein L32